MTRKGAEKGGDRVILDTAAALSRSFATPPLTEQGLE
jgi:hypothetical protein